MEECSIRNTTSSANVLIAFYHAQRCGSHCLGELCGAQPYVWQVHGLVHLRKYPAMQVFTFTLRTLQLTCIRSLQTYLIA